MDHDDSEERDVVHSEVDIGKLTAKDKMKELAKKIYDSTPGIQEQFPKKQSKILSDVEPEDEIAPKRAKKFMQKCEQIAELRDRRKYGSINERNLSKLQLFKLCLTASLYNSFGSGCLGLAHVV